MNCPKCGLQILPDQKFCRSCGNTLQLITQPLTFDARLSRMATTPAAIILQDETRRTSSLPLWGMITMFIGVALGIIGKMLLHEEMMTVIGVLVSLVGMFLTVYPSLAPTPRRRKSEAVAPTPTETLPTGHATRHLPPESDIEYISSITERTTDLLKESAVNRLRPKAGVESEV